MNWAYVEFSTWACPAVVDGCLVYTNLDSAGSICDDISSRRNVAADNVRVRTVTPVPVKLVPSLHSLLPTLQENQIPMALRILSLMLK